MVFAQKSLHSAHQRIAGLLEAQNAKAASLTARAVVPVLHYRTSTAEYPTAGHRLSFLLGS
jgi:hypothetical protein